MWPQLQVADDRVPRDAVLEQVERLDREIEHAPGDVEPDLR